ncbi:MAG: leucine-rich repeat protein, partial [Clostridia bacterium]|nr:leucine-rich repeat protein [Clostridia bacterium]
MKNKKAFGGIIVLLLMVIMLSFLAYGADELYTYKDFSYTVRDDDTVQIVKYDGTKKSVTVPSKIDGKPVTVIGSHAFSSCINLQNLTIPGSVRDLHECAVSYCPKLKSLVIKDGNLKNLDYMDIYSCRSLKTLSLPKNL